MSGLTFKVADVAKVRDAAKAKGCPVSGDSFQLCGVTFRLGVRERCGTHRCRTGATRGTHNPGSGYVRIGTDPPRLMR